MEDTKRTRPTEPTKKFSYRLTKAEMASMGLHGFAPGSLLYVMAFIWVFCGTPNNESKFITDSFASSWDAFLPIGLPSPSSLDMRVFALSDCIPFYHVWLLR